MIVAMNAVVKKDFEEGDPRFMTSLARGLDMLRSFEGQTSLTVTQAAKATGLSRSAAGRCLFTLEQLGYVAAQEGSYSLTQAVLPLARAFTAADPLSRNGQAVVDVLRDRLGESSSLALFDPRCGQTQVLYVCRAETARIISVPLLAGSTLPSHCTSNGRVLLAGLKPTALRAFLAHAPFPAHTACTLTTAEALREEIESVRGRGWAITDGELAAGLRSVAVPVCGPGGEVKAALNLATQSSRRALDWLTGTALPELQAAAAHLARVTAS